jgi:hypothetical protein
MTRFGVVWTSGADAFAPMLMLGALYEAARQRRGSAKDCIFGPRGEGMMVVKPGKSTTTK